MSILELIAAAKETVVDERKLEEMQLRIQEAEIKFETDSLSKSVNTEFLARTYSL